MLFNNKMNHGWDYYHKMTEANIRSKMDAFLLNIGITQYSLDIDINKIVYKRNPKIMNYCAESYHPFKIELNINLKKNNDIYTHDQLLNLLKNIYMYHFMDIIIDDSIYRLHNTNIKKNIKKINKKYKNICSVDIMQGSNNFFSYIVEFHDYNIDKKNFSIKNMTDVKYSYVLKISQILSFLKTNVNIDMIEKDFKEIHKQSLPSNYHLTYERYPLIYNEFDKYLHNKYNGIFKKELISLINSLSKFTNNHNIYINYKM